MFQNPRCTLMRIAAAGHRPLVVAQFPGALTGRLVVGAHKREERGKH
jgi:hypothetical protein